MYKRILVPVDGSPTSNRGLDEAIRIASFSAGRIRLMHVLDELLYANGFESYLAYAGEVIPLMKNAGEDVLQRAAKRVLASGLTAETVLCETLGRRVADMVNDEVRAWSADLVVLGTHGRRGASRFFMGSDAEQVARVCEVPVLLVRPLETDTGESRASTAPSQAA